MGKCSAREHSKQNDTTFVAHEHSKLNDNFCTPWTFKTEQHNFCKDFRLSPQKHTQPHKHARFDLEAFWLRPVMAIMASMQPELCQIVYAWSDFPQPVAKKAQITLCKTDLDLIRMAWSGFGQTSCLEASQCAKITRPGSAKMQPACCLPLPDSVAFFNRQPGSARIQFGSGWLCQVSVKRIWSGCKRVCKNHPAHFWPTLLSLSGSDAGWIWHVYWERTWSEWSGKTCSRRWRRPDVSVTACQSLPPPPAGSGRVEFGLYGRFSQDESLHPQRRPGPYESLGCFHCTAGCRTWGAAQGHRN